jgi:hypothetical protein
MSHDPIDPIKTARILWHMLRADFLERVRRYSFFVILAATVWLGYLVGTGKLGLWIGGARGVFNSAWIGTAMALVINSFLALFGFYIVKGSVDRDRQTGVGQILATTPLSKPLYTLGKAASNFAVLSTMVGVLAAASVVIQLTAAEDPHIQLGALLLPFVLLSLPVMALVASTAVLFETTPGLRGGFGNVVWFFLWMGGLAQGIGKAGSKDLLGLGPVYGDMIRAFQAKFGAAPHGFLLGGMDHQEPVKTFLWNGVDWTADALAGRLVWAVLAVGFAFLAALFFDRFDPSLGGLRRQPAAGGIGAVGENGEILEMNPPAAPRPSPVTLTPLISIPTGGASFRFTAVLRAELKLALKGQRWWWYAGAAGLFLAGLLNQPQAVKEIVLPLTWIWPILVWSPLGTRESRFDTGGLLFSSARPLLRQLPATWLAGVLLAMATGSGAAVRFLAAGDHTALGAWLVGALFIPSLALALGVWSGTSKLFEVIYLVIWYIGPMNHVSTLDYLGATKTGSAEGMPLIYLGLTALLAVTAVAGRKRQLAG